MGEKEMRKRAGETRRVGAQMKGEEAATTTLFSPLKLAHITLKNRVVRSATETLMGTAEDGHLSEPQYALYEQLGRGEVGLIIYENTCVSPEGRSLDNQTAIWDDCYIDGFARLVRGAKQEGSKIIMQLGHGGDVPGCSAHNGGRALVQVNRLDKKGIARIRQSFIAAARRAQQAGFDGVQIHNAHGYLLSQFFDKGCNHRADEYGKTAAGRFRLSCEIIEGIKTACGDDFPVFLKINSDAGDDESYFDDLCQAASLAQQAGLEGMELSGSHSTPTGIPAAPYFLNTALRLRDQTSLPLLLVGGIRTRAQADAVLAAGIELVSFSRPLICDPFFVRHTLIEGKKTPCLSCNGCFAAVLEHGKRCVLHQ